MMFGHWIGEKLRGLLYVFTISQRVRVWVLVGGELLSTQSVRSRHTHLLEVSDRSYDLWLDERIQIQPSNSTNNEEMI